MAQNANYEKNIENCSWYEIWQPDEPDNEEDID
jgi:hypothetical protein